MTTWLIDKSALVRLAASLDAEWHHVYGGNRPDLARALEFHDRWLPGTMRRIAAITWTCGQSGDHAIMGYHLEAEMTDVLIRDVPDEVIAALDAHAGRLGLSRSEYVRRRLAQDASTPGSPVSVEDLTRFANTFADLADPDVMSQAWK